MWGLTSSITIVLSHYSSEVYRAKGRPRLSVLAQVLHIVVLWPTVLIAVKYGFETLYTARSLVRLELIAVNLCIMGWVVKMPIGRMFTNTLPSCLAAVCMLMVLLLPSTSDIWLNIVYAIIATIIYVVVVMLFPEERRTLLNMPKIIKNK